MSKRGLITSPGYRQQQSLIQLARRFGRNSQVFSALYCNQDPVLAKTLQRFGEGRTFQ